MNEYPEWLIDGVAAAIAEGVDDCTGLFDPTGDGDEMPHSENYINEMREGAVAVLDALGFAPWGGATYWRSNIQWEAKA